MYKIFRVVCLKFLQIFFQLLKVISVALSKRCEFEADRFATTLGHGDALKRALISLHKDNLGYPLYDKLFSKWHLSHPTLLERISVIDKEE